MRAYAILFLLLFLGFCQGNRVDEASATDSSTESSQGSFPYLAVVPFQPGHPDPELRRFAAALTSLTRSVLLGYSRLQLLDPLATEQRSTDDARLHAAQSGVHFLLGATVDYDDGRYSIRPYLMDLRTGERSEADSIVTPASALGTVPFDITIRMDELAESMNLRSRNDPWITGREKELGERSFKPSIDAFRYFAYGVAAEEDSPSVALHYYAKALAIEPYFMEARDRSFLLENRSLAATGAGYINATQNAQVLMRYNRLHPMNVALTYQEFGRRSMSVDRSLASKWFQESNRWLYLEGRYRSSYYANNQNGIGSIQLYFNNSGEAMTRFQSAHELLQSLEMQGSLALLENQINLGNAYAASQTYNRSMQYYDAAQRFVETRKSSPAIRALIEYNRGVMYYVRGQYRLCIEESLKARKDLLDSGLGNSALSLAILLNINASLIQQRRYSEALQISDRLGVLARSIGQTTYPSYRYSLHNAGYALDKLGRTLEAMQARRGSNMGYGLNRPLYETFLSAEELPSANLLFQTDAEERQIASYTGAFDMRYHAQQVRSRTYPGRQDDTNILLRDLLYGRKKDAAMERLRELLHTSGSDSEGSGFLFIDVGPGLANVQYPAVTTKSIAQDFRRMDVVALDLPEQVRLFYSQVSAYRRDELLSHSNIRILSADGRESLAKVFSDPERWPVKNRGSVPLRGRTVVIRMANSIDIYLPWSVMQDVLRQLALDLKDSPVLLCFNRSILVKPAGSLKFQIAGYVSIRGFHHNLELLDRGGEPPYTLIDTGDFAFLR